MKLGSNNSINFQARISDKVYKQIVKQTREYPISHKLRKKLYSQINKVYKWGSKGSEIVTCKNYMGYYVLGLKFPLKQGLELTWAIERLKGRTELSQFLRLTEKNINDTENTIKYLYDKYGISV